MEQERKHRRTYPAEFRAGAVAMARKGEQRQKDIAKALGCCERQLRRWIVQADIDAGKRPGLTTNEQYELTRLRRANVLLQERIQLMEEARDFFARETR